MNLLQMSFSGAAFITAVVIIRAVAINKLPKKTFLVLWEWRLRKFPKRKHKNFYGIIIRAILLHSQ